MNIDLHLLSTLSLLDRSSRQDGNSRDGGRLDTSSQNGSSGSPGAASEDEMSHPRVGKASPIVQS